MDEERALYIVRAGEAGAIERVLRDYSDKSVYRVDGIILPIL
ncbi:RIC8B isoform 13 [Pan troglodytes]|uniref:RIC8 guanine nucleotide exchange factor B n=3 Tax=Hominidae TaxID=9604 RepID=F8VSN5_HUMAN|nr:RIC8B isoform 13 [Pan troglodytes]PNJ83023.1 RIC8B isoform 13 [Pongo abelii]